MSFGALPASFSTSSSLLFPPNPAITSPETTPKGGILLNIQRGSEPFPRSPPLPSQKSNNRLSADFDSPITPSSPIYPDNPPSILSPSASSTATSASRIRFAPLPDPRRPRSLSTGQNVVWKASLQPNGDRTRAIAIRVNSPEYDDDDGELEDGDEEEGEEGNGKRGRMWSKSMSKTMGMSGSWKGTKKLLGYSTASSKEKEREDAGYSEGAPLKKSVSTGGFIGASPFRWSSEQERKRSMQGIPPPRETGHRRNSSMEVSPSRTSSSPGLPTVKLLNGRVYGSRRASEAAERHRLQREQDEPAFVEWGHGKAGGGLGANAPATAGRSLLGDEEDGSGMEWVKRRREEREKKRIEEEQGVSSQPVTPEKPAIQAEEAQEHQTKAINIPSRATEEEEESRGSVFEDEEEGDDEGENDSEEEEEEEQEATRTTSSAAGVEKLSRHKD